MTDDEEYWRYKITRIDMLQIISGDDKHSVYHVILSMLADDHIWRPINASRHNRRERCDKLHQLLDWGYWSTQAIALRRITEDNDSLRKKAVYSIPRVINHLSNNAPLIKRKHYIRRLAEDGKSGLSGHANAWFDEIAEVAGPNRSEDDIISKSYLEKLGKIVRHKLFENISRFVNKHIVHSSDPGNRSDQGISLSEIDEAITRVSYVTNELSAKVLCGPSLSFMLSPIQTVLDGRDSPTIDDEEVGIVQSELQAREKFYRELGQIPNPKLKIPDAP